MDLGAGAAALATLAPDAGLGPGSSLDAVSAPAGAVLGAVARLVTLAALDRTVLLVLEDLQWSDASTRDLVSYLCRGLQTSRVLLVVSVRTHPSSDPGIDDLLHELVRLAHVERLDLRPLGPDGVVRQMAGILGTPPEAGWAERVVRRSGGVPFFVEELAAAGDVGDHEVPEGLRQLVLRRTRLLPRAATAAMRAVATAGGPVDERTIAVVSGLPTDTLGEALRELVDDDQLVVDRSVGRYDVRHALLREAIGDDLLPGETESLHGRHAELLEEAGSEDATAVISAAHHWRMARRPERAYPAGLRAAAAARSVSAYAEELLLLEGCLSMWPAVESPATVEVPDRAELLAAAGRAARLAGRYATSRVLLQQARIELGREQPARSSQVLFEEALLLRSIGDAPGVEEELWSLLDALPPGPSSTRATALNALVQIQLHQRHDDEELLATVRAAADAATGAGEPVVAAHLQVTHAALVAGAPDSGLADGLLSSAWEVGERLDDVALMLRVLDTRARLLVGRGQFREGAAVARDGLRLAADRGSSVLMPDYLLGTLCDALLAVGDWDEGVAVLEGALRVERPNIERGGLYARLGALRAATGDLDGARAATSLAGSRLGARSADPSLLVLLATVEAELALAEGRPTEAAGIACRAIERVGTLVRPAETWRLLRVAAAASVASARRSGGSPPDRLVEAVREQRAREPGSPWVHILAAELADDDADRWRRAAAAAEDETVPVLVRLQVLSRAGETALAAGSRVEAADLLGEVVRASTRLGARGVLDAARDLVSRARLKVEDAGVVAIDRSGPDGLTPRELEVLRLVAAGRSNASIAASLVISTKTVSVHVSHILDKLGVASRGEAAATARARGLVGPEQPAHRRQ